MTQLPEGTVTYLFTDVESSTRLWEQYPDAMRQALIRHDALFEHSVVQQMGFVVKPRGEGDSRFAVFTEAAQAVMAAAAFQRSLSAENWMLPAPLRVRAALHTGESDLREGDYYGSEVNRCARLRAIAHGGQTVLSQMTGRLAENKLPEGISLRDMGEHRLKDLTRPEHVLQLVLTGITNEFPALLSVDSFPNNLPIQMTRFIGREHQVEDIKRLLGQTRLLTLTGPGGTGKTRLSLQVAADVLEMFKQGVWLVELAPISDPDYVPATVAGALGLQTLPGIDARTALVAYLRDKQLLIVLDNCEHLVSPCAGLAEYLLRACSQLKIVASSREALGVLGEVAWSVPSLSVPDVRKQQTVEAFSNYEAVQLFIDRAAAIRPDFCVTTDNAPAIAKICQRLDGIPLAIELATSRLRGLSVDQIATRLDDRFRLLTGGNRTALPRHQTLRTLIDWSYELLSKPEQMLLRRLSVFVGGWTLEAAEAVCPDDQLLESDVLDHLLSLVNKSLVTPEDYEGITRYRLLETIRQYARDKLFEMGEGEMIRDRHFEYFRAYAAAHEPRLRTPDQPRIFILFDADYDNFRAALEWSQGNGLAEDGLELLANLVFFWFRRGLFNEGMEWADTLFALTEGSQSVNRGMAQIGIALLAARIGLGEKARTLAESAEAMLAGKKHKFEELVMLFQVAVGFNMEYHESRPFIERAIEVGRRENHVYFLASALFLLGDRMRVAGDYNAAERAYLESLSYFEQLGDEEIVIYPGGNLGRLALLRGDYAKARHDFEQAIVLARKINSRLAVADWLIPLATLNLLEGNLADARSIFDECLPLCREMGNRPGVSDCLVLAAGIALAAGDRAKAARLLGASRLFRGDNDTMSEPDGGAMAEYFTQRTREAMDEQEFALLYAEGMRMKEEQALALANGG